MCVGTCLGSLSLQGLHPLDLSHRGLSSPGPVPQEGPLDLKSRREGFGGQLCLVGEGRAAAVPEADAFLECKADRGLLARWKDEVERALDPTQV